MVIVHPLSCQNWWPHNFPIFRGVCDHVTAPCISFFPSPTYHSLAGRLKTHLSSCSAASTSRSLPPLCKHGPSASPWSPYTACHRTTNHTHPSARGVGGVTGSLLLSGKKLPTSKPNANMHAAPPLT